MTGFRFPRDVALRMLAPTRDLDPTDPLEAALVGEASLLSDWTLISPTVVHTGRDTSAHSGVIGINTDQLRAIYGTLQGEQLETALFLSLAHEIGHLCQEDTFTDEELSSTLSPLEQEAHADVIAGVWLGQRLASGEPRLPEHLKAACFCLHSESANYPSVYQRTCLTETGMGHTVLLVTVLEPQIPEESGYTQLRCGLRDQDVRDLADIAKRVLRETPHDE